MAARWRAAAAVWAAIIAVSGSAGLTACTGSTGNQVDYAVDGTLVTYNTTTVIGAASAGPQAFARTLTGFGYHGPDGQVVADRDFGTISVVGRAPLILDYQIAEKAVYSDDKPVTCDDMVLAWAAQSGRYLGFHAASRAGYADIAAIDCQPGHKKARVTFAQDRSFADHDELFTATSMMPSHVIAAELGIDNVTTPILGNVAPLVDRIAQAWNTTWDLKTDFDPKHFPSSGPYQLHAVQDSGAVVLVANDRWWGVKPITKQITVWPRGAGIADRLDQRGLDVVDVATGSAGALPAPDGYQRTDAPSGGVEQLIFAPQGPLAEPAARRALALCTPRDAIAHDAAVPIADARLFTALEDAYDEAERAAPDQFIGANPDAAREALHGAPLAVRIGYGKPDQRRAAVVAAIAAACAPAGITVTDAAGETTGPQALLDGQIDVLLASTGGAAGSGSTGSSASDAYALFTGNGNNLSGYRNGQIDGIISALAVTVDPAEAARLLTESVPVLWTDLPTLPLYRQQRTLVVSRAMSAVTANPTRWGAGWNMDRWALQR